MASPLIITIVALYLAGMLFIGWLASRRIRSNEDFMVAGRRLGPVMLAGTLAATEVGGGSSMGVAEKAYGAWGMSASWYVITMTITFVVLAFIAPRLRRSMVKTVPEYFHRRYGPPSALLTAIIMILPLVGLSAIQIIASSVILSVMLGLSYPVCVVLVTVVVTIYSVLGGLWSVTLTDVVQWCLIVIGLAVAVPFAIEASGGWAQAMSYVPQQKMSLTEGMGTGTIISLVVMYVASFSVGQEAVQRYFAARDERAAMWGSLLAGGVYLLFALVPAVLGILAFSMVEQGVLDASLIEARGTRYVLPVLAIAVLPAWLVGVVFAALISATMSSADSDLLAAGSIFSNDIYARYFRRDASDEHILRVTRLAMVGVALLALIIALTSTDNLIAILMFSFTLRAGGAFFPYVLGHFWRRSSAAGAMASLVAGSAAVLLVEHDLVSVAGLDPIIPGLAVSLVAFVGVSLARPDQLPAQSSGDDRLAPQERT